MNPGAVGSNPAADISHSNHLLSLDISGFGISVACVAVTPPTLHPCRRAVTVAAMANLLKRGSTYYVRLTIPGDRWSDVGRALGARSGIKREVVRTLETGDYREAQRRRDGGLTAAREMVDLALRRHGLKPLTDWTADWVPRATERRAQLQAGADKVNGWVEGPPGLGPVPIMEADLTLETVEAEAAQLEAHRGPDAARHYTQIAIGRGMSVSEAARHWTATIRGTVREGTLAGYQASLVRLGKYLSAHEGFPPLEAVNLASVTRRMAGDVIAARRADRASETVQRDFSAYNGLWRWAMRRGHAEVNPWTDQTAGIKAPRFDENGEGKRAYTAVELVKLLRAGKDDLAPRTGGYGPALWDAIRLALLTGARASELVGLRVGDVIEDGTAIATPKRGKTANASRIIPLHTLAQAVLKARLASLPDLAVDALVWPEVPGADGDDRRSKTLVSRFIPVRRRLLGPDDGADFHSLRRNFITACETAQHTGGRINPDLTALIVGHKRGSMALDLYSEWSRLGRRITGSLTDKLATLRAAVDDAVELGFPAEVLTALADTKGDRPAVKRTGPAFSRITRPLPVTHTSVK